MKYRVSYKIDEIVIAEDQLDALIQVIEQTQERLGANIDDIVTYIKKEEE